MRLIETDNCVLEGVEWLAKAEPRFAYAYEQTGPLPLRRRPDGFDRLLSAIVSQQVSVASATAIWNKLEAAGMTSPELIIQTSDDDLRALGLSRQKARYARALAEADIDYIALREMPTDDVVKTLVAVPGIGVWTAEIYAMFALGHADVLPAGDLALQEAARILFEHDERPKEKAFRTMGDAWAPWRSVAARLLWAYYAVAKDREGIR